MIDVESRWQSTDSVLPDDVVDRIAMTARPEKRLMLAVLEGAVGDFRKYATAPSGLGRRRFVEADAWFKSTACDRLLDFESVCHALALDPSLIRGGLERWRIARRRAAERSKPAPFRQATDTPPQMSLAGGAVT